MTNRAIAFDNGKAYLGTSAVAIFTVPANTVGTLQKLHLHNKSGTTNVAVTIYVDLAGTTADNTTRRWYRVLGPQVDLSVSIVGLTGLPPGAKIYALADTANEVTVVGSVNLTPAA